MKGIQNIYDNDDFFAGYKQIRSRAYNYNTLLELPQMKRMLPDPTGKCVLDVGCGSGGFSAYCIEQGAAHVVGLDASSNMMTLAKDMYGHLPITFITEPLEHIKFEPQTFDIICSSLALHYIEDFDMAINKLSEALKPGGQLLFSHHHPVTSANFADDDWIIDEQGRHQYLKVHRYFDEGERLINWLVGDVKMYHRTLATILNTLIRYGLTIEEVVESKPTDEAIEKLPSIRKELERPSFIFVKATKR